MIGKIPDGNRFLTRGLNEFKKQQSKNCEGGSKGRSFAGNRIAGAIKIVSNSTNKNNDIASRMKNSEILCDFSKQSETVKSHIKCGKEYRGKGDNLDNYIDKYFNVIARGGTEFKKIDPLDYEAVMDGRNLAERLIAESIERMSNAIDKGDVIVPEMENQEMLCNLRKLHAAITSYAPGGRNESQLVLVENQENAIASVYQDDKEERILFSQEVIDTYLEGVAQELCIEQDVIDFLAISFIHELTHQQLSTSDYFYIGGAYYGEGELQRDLKGDGSRIFKLINDKAFNIKELYNGVFPEIAERDKANDLHTEIKDRIEKICHERENISKLIKQNADSLTRWISDYGSRDNLTAL